MKKLFPNFSLVVLTFCLMLCSKMFSQDYYSIVADSCDDSLFCVRHNPFFDFETQGIITGTTIPDQNVTLRHGSMNQLQEAIKLILDSTFGYSIQGIPVAFSIVVDTSGVARGVIVKTSSPINIVSLSAARVVFNFLKTKSFIPASLHGKPVISVFPVVYRIGKELDFDAIATPPETWPSYNNDVDYKKLTIFLKENLHYDDTMSVPKIVYIKCVVDTLGNTHNHKVTQGASPSLDKEAIRVCRLIKFDNPAMQNGRPVSIDFTIPVKFEPNQIPKPKSRHCLFKFWK